MAPVSSAARMMGQDDGVARGLPGAVAEGDRLVEHHGQAVAGTAAAALRPSGSSILPCSTQTCWCVTPARARRSRRHTRARPETHLDDVDR